MTPSTTSRHGSLSTMLHACVLSSSPVNGASWLQCQPSLHEHPCLIPAQLAVAVSARKPTPARAAAKRSQAIIESDDDEEDVPPSKVSARHGDLSSAHLVMSPL